MTERDVNLASDHVLVMNAREELHSKIRIPVRHGDRIGDLTTGNHVTFNLGEEIEMFKNFGFCRIEEVYVKKQKKGDELIERYTPDGEYSAYPDHLNPTKADGNFKGRYICGQEILVFRSFQPETIIANVEIYPETQIPDEFIRRETEAFLKDEL